jgi:hypothetical protein
MVATSELERAVNDRLAEHDLRYTAGRRAIVEGLKAADGPVTLPELLPIWRKARLTGIWAYSKRPVSSDGWFTAASTLTSNSPNRSPSTTTT